MATKDMIIVSKKDLVKINKALTLSATAVQNALVAVGTLAGEQPPKKTRAKKATPIAEQAQEAQVEAAVQSTKPVASAQPPASAAKTLTTKTPVGKAPIAKAKSNGSFHPAKMPG